MVPPVIAPPSSAAPVATAAATSDAAVTTADSATGTVTWKLSASTRRLSMATRADWRLRVAATNAGSSVTRPSIASLRFRVNQQPSFGADLAFSNGIMEAGWMALDPGKSVMTERAVGLKLFTTPGAYQIELVDAAGAVATAVQVEVVP